MAFDSDYNKPEPVVRGNSIICRVRSSWNSERAGAVIARQSSNRCGRCWRPIRRFGTSKWRTARWLLGRSFRVKLWPNFVSPPRRSSRFATGAAGAGRGSSGTGTDRGTTERRQRGSGKRNERRTMKAAYIRTVVPMRYSIRRSPSAGAGERRGTGPRRCGGRQSHRFVHPCRHSGDAAAQTVHRRLRPGRDRGAVGPAASRFKVGDRVWGSNQGLLGRQGTFAEYAAVAEDWLYPTSKGVDDKTAAAAALVGITAHLGLFRDAQLKSGEIVFVNGGTGGVGAMVVQMAKAAGAKVITTVGSADKAKLCQAVGCRLRAELQERRHHRSGP